MVVDLFRVEARCDRCRRMVRADFSRAEAERFAEEHPRRVIMVLECGSEVRRGVRCHTRVAILAGAFRRARRAEARDGGGDGSFMARTLDLWRRKS